MESRTSPVAVHHVEEQLYDTDGVSSDDHGDDIALLEQFESLPSRLTTSTNAAGKCTVTNIVVALLAVVLMCVVVVVGVKYGFRGRNGVGENMELTHFIQISDTHLDLYYDETVTNKNGQQCRNRHTTSGHSIEKLNTSGRFGRVGCDSPRRLLKSLVEHLRNLKQVKEGKIEFVVLTGDQVAHDYVKFDVNLLQSVLWSLVNSTRMISEALPGVPILLSIGNNDLRIDNDPPVQNHSMFYQLLYEKLQQYVFPDSLLVDQLNSKEDFQDTFEFGGYYSVNIDERNTVVMLNTNYWSVNSYKLDRNITVIGDRQITWLHGQLETAQMEDRLVILTGHIPPGIDFYNGKSLWLSNYTEAYISLVTQKFSEVIKIQLYGHVHQGKILLQSPIQLNNSIPASDSFALTCPSVTPIYGNNPAFRVFTYNELDRTSLDYVQHYFDLAASNANTEPYWLKGSSFPGAFGVTLSPKGVKHVVDDMLRPSSEIWGRYAEHMTARGGGVRNSQRYSEFCAARYYDQSSYTNCLKKYENIGV